MRYAPVQLVQRALEPQFFDRLEKIVDGIRLKSAKRVLLVGGRKDHGRFVLRVNLPQDIKAVPVGHLNVQEKEVRIKLFYHLLSFISIHGFTGYFYGRVLL